MNTEDSEFARIEREQALRVVPEAIHHTDIGETLEYIQGWNDCRAAMLAEQPAQQEPALQNIEQYRMQMAGICTAAIGYWKEGDSIHPDYDTLALRDVAKLYAKYDELYKTAQRKPLTNKFLEALAEKHVTNCYFDTLAYARAIEAAHGIKKNT